MKFTYEGEVVLGCQEGGCAAPEIRLEELPDGSPQGVTAKGRSLFCGEDQPRTLDEILKEKFGPTVEQDFGDESVGKLRITIERAPTRETGNYLGGVVQLLSGADSPICPASGEGD